MVKDQGKYTIHRWRPGIVINSETEYHELSKNLAEELIQQHSMEELAIIAAQHLIYVDAIQQGSQETQKVTSCRHEIIEIQKRHIQTISEELDKRLTPAEAAKICHLVLAHFRKKKWGKGGKSRHRDTEQHKSSILAEWDRDKSGYKSRADFCRIISKRDGLKERTVYTWIANHEKLKVKN
jgi:hypothetical protein